MQTTVCFVFIFFWHLMNIMTTTIHTLRQIFDRFPEATAWPFGYMLGPPICESKSPHWVVCKAALRPTKAFWLIWLRPLHQDSVGCQLPCKVQLLNQPSDWISMVIFYVLPVCCSSTPTPLQPLVFCNSTIMCLNALNSCSHIYFCSIYFKPIFWPVELTSAIYSKTWN